MSRDDLIFQTSKQCIDLVNTIDELEDHKVIFRQGLKQSAKRLSNECDRLLSSQFKDNPKLTEIFDRDALLEGRLKELTTSERLAVDSFIDQIIALRDDT